MAEVMNDHKYRPPRFNQSAKNDKLSVKIFLLVCGSAVRFLFRPRFYGLGNIPSEGAVILTGNHTSLMDVALIHPVVSRKVHWVAKDELRTKPILGKLFTSFEAIFLRRDKLDVTAIKSIMATLRNDKIVGIFPQGTRIKHNIQESGAATGLVSIMQKTGAQVVPFYIDAPYRLFRPMKVIFGEAYVLPKSHKKASADVMSALQNTIMRKIFELGGIAYRPEKEASDIEILQENNEDLTL